MNADEENLIFRRTASTSWLRFRGSPKLSVTNTAAADVGNSDVSKSKKLGTFSGVFVPTTLNVLSILMFLRFGFILGQTGVLGMMCLLFASYLINFLTTFSLSAISSNGTVRGGGAYYLISRSLGPEFGGSIGLVFYLGFVFNTGMNAVGLIDCILNNFGQISGTVLQYFPESFWHRYLYATVVLVFCTVVCLAGSAIFARASNLLLAILLVATFSIPISSLFVKPYGDDRTGIIYTGLSMETLMENLMPRFTKGAAGSSIDEVENWQNMFGILFPATAGIFAGASMSGDLRNPSKSIPTGTLWGLLFTFFSYALVIFSMGATIARPTLYKDLNVIQDVNGYPPLILMGEFATSFFSALMGVIGSAKLLQALARDSIFPYLGAFGQGTKATDDPVLAILFTFVLAQVTLFMDINSIASFVTMTYLVTFFVMNFACFVLKIGSAPNFRPTFKFFSWWTAAAGALASLVAMFLVDGTYATGVIGMVLALFLVIHYTSPPKTWGDVSQSLIYHQVRKYLLRLKTEHVKFWRPQILLLVNDPRRSWKLIQFCNALKKGGLYVLGHVVVTPEFQESFPEVKKQQSAWMKYIDFSKIKAFPQVTIAPTFEWGARNIVLSAGLGGMRPNIAIMGFFNMDEYRASKPLIDLGAGISSSASSIGKGKVRQDDVRAQLPTDSMRSESSVTPMSYVNVLDDLLSCLQINFAIAKGFDDLQLPTGAAHEKKKYIDLWPIQMSVEIEGYVNGNISTNFDTYTLILQLGTILNTVKTWKKAYTLRVIVFVEYESDVEEERLHVKKLLEDLRIEAEVIVTWLARGDLPIYEAIVNGSDNMETAALLQKTLGDEPWWTDLQDRRQGLSNPTASVEISTLANEWPGSSFQQMGRTDLSRSHGTRVNLGKLRNAVRRHSHSVSGMAIRKLSMAINMRTRRLNPDAVHHVSESDESSDDEESTEGSAVSEGDLSDYSDDERVAFDFGRPRRASTGDGLRAPVWDTAATATRSAPVDNKMESAASAESSSTTMQNLVTPDKKFLSPDISRLRAAGMDRASLPSFSCKAIPETQLATGDGPGPSIMFAIENERRSRRKSSRHSLGSNHSLSFNDFPSRAQHLILNELIRRYSDETAVIITTLPSPPPESYKSESLAVAYLEGLELLTEGLPPTLLVHSSSLCVTTEL
ncbi:amino acid permease-domain-containing protein [Pyronema domesticum]|nr:amino acid permease-domain-containing protein [Pyronema domesticum]